MTTEQHGRLIEITLDCVKNTSKLLSLQDEIVGDPGSDLLDVANMQNESNSKLIKIINEPA